MKAPSEEELAAARRFVQRDGAPVPINAEWFVLADGRVLTRYRGSGGWGVSLLGVAALTVVGGDWVEL